MMTPRELTLYRLEFLSLPESGSEYQTVNITKFKSQPVADVSIVVDVDPLYEDFLSFNPSSGNFTVLKGDWENIGQTFGFKALAAAPDGDPNIVLRIVSDDPDYDNLANIPVSANVVATTGELTGSPNGIVELREGGAKSEYGPFLQYTIRRGATPVPSDRVNVTLVASDKCNVNPSTFFFG